VQTQLECVCVVRGTRDAVEQCFRELPRKNGVWVASGIKDKNEFVQLFSHVSYDNPQAVWTYLNSKNGTRE